MGKFKNYWHRQCAILVFPTEASLVLKTLYTQEMLKRGFLASNVIYISLAHERHLCDQFLAAFEIVIKILKNAHFSETYNDLLEGPVCHSGFQRLIDQ